VVAHNDVAIGADATVDTLEEVKVPDHVTMIAIDELHFYEDATSVVRAW
jgi:hypothetical protein